jgi:type VI secretion system protein ImpJ
MTPLLDWMERVLNSIERPYTIIPFLQNDRLFYHKLARHWIPNHIVVGVRIPTTMDTGELRDWMRECVIATESHVETVRMKRVTGASREIIEGEELADIMPGAGLQLYRIKLDPHYIKPGETLMIFHAADQPSRRPLGIVLYIKGSHPLEDEPTEQEG